MKTLGEKIKELRKAAGMNQEELATKLGVQKGAVSTWERNLIKPSFERLNELCSLLQVSLPDLVSESDEIRKIETEAVWMEEARDNLAVDSYCEEIAEYADILARLDEYGQKAVRSIIRAEKDRCTAQGSYNSEGNFNVLVKRNV